MSRPRAVLVVVAGTRPEAAEWLTAHDAKLLPGVDDLTVMDNSDMRAGGFGAIANHALATTRCDVLGLIHADVFLHTVEPFVDAAVRTPALSGIVGITVAGRYVWAKEATATTPVSTLDSCSLFIPVAVARAKGLMFDEIGFPGFHLVVADFCLYAAQRGLPSVVPSCLGWTEHRGTRWREPQWQADYAAGLKRLTGKWAGVPFEVT